MDSQNPDKPPDQQLEDDSEFLTQNIFLPILENIIDSAVERGNIIDSAVERGMKRKRKAKTSLSDVPQSKLSKDEPEVPELKKRQIGDLILVPLQKFAGNKLPTKSQVLQRIFHLIDSSPPTTAIKSISEDIFLEIEPIYKKAFALPKSTMSKVSCVATFTKLHNNYKTILKHTNRKLSAKDLEFIKDLDKLCDLAPVDLEKQISLDRLRSEFKKKQDIDFYKDQKTIRRLEMEKLDKDYAKKVDAKEARNTRNVSSGTAQEIVQSETSEIEENISDSSSSGEVPNEEQDEEFVPSRFLRSERENASVKCSVMISNSALLSILDRTNTSSRKGVMIMGAVLAATGQSITDQTLSKNSLERQRKKVRSETAKEIKANFVPPKRSIVHFDGKMLKDLAGEFGDRLAVMLSGNTEQCKQGKLLSARLIQDGSGESQSKEVVRALKEWKVFDSVVGHCFDTTSSNTGWQKGAAVRIEKGLKRALLWLPCRHHISELILRAAWESIFGEDMGPYYTEFKQFQSNWSNLNKTKTSGLDLQEEWMHEKADDIIKLCQTLLESDWARDDYKECIELVLFLLGHPPENFTFKLPGAMSKARWMAVLIYGIKIFLFRKALKKGKKEQKKLERFVIFGCLFYIKHWVMTRFASEAPHMDLKLYKDMIAYKEFDNEVADAVLDKLTRHTWYLNMEYVPFTLFSKLVPEEEKAEIAMKLSKVKPPKKYKGGYPSEVQVLKDYEFGANYKLSDSIMYGSLYLFDTLKIDREWLDKPIAQWEEYDSYLEMEDFVRNLLVTNDAAERGIKLCHDFAKSLTKDAQEMQDLLQTVEKNRQELPNANKSSIVKYCQPGTSKDSN